MCVCLHKFVLSENTWSSYQHACRQNVLNLYLDKECGAMHVQNYVIMYSVSHAFLFLQLECSDRHLSLVSLSSRMSYCKDYLSSILEDRKYMTYIIHEIY